MKIEDGTETLNINSSHPSLLTLHIVHYSLKCLSFCTAWLENTYSTFRFHYNHTNLSHTHTCLHTLGYNRSLYTLRSFQQILKCLSSYIMKVYKYAYSLRQRILSLEWTPVSQHFYVAITVFVFRAKSDGFRSTSRNEPSLRMNSNGTFTTNTSLFQITIWWSRDKKRLFNDCLICFAPRQDCVLWTSPSVELYFILGHQLSRKSPATHLEDEITKRNAVNEKPGNGQATGLVALGLGRADIGIVNDDPLLVRPIGLLSKIRVFDIRVGSLIRASKPPCCHFSWIGCIRL